MGKNNKPRKFQRTYSIRVLAVVVAVTLFGSFAGSQVLFSSANSAARSRVVYVAAHQVGNKEYGSQVMAYHGGAQPEAWCADFVSWVYRAAGYSFSGSYYSGGWRYPRATNPGRGISLKTYAEDRKVYRPRGTYHPRAADVIYFNTSHVGIVSNVYYNSYYGWLVETIEGNADNPHPTPDGVERRVYGINDSRIMGYGAFLP